jgi:hypothetical protein
MSFYGCRVTPTYTDKYTLLEAKMLPACVTVIIQLTTDLIPHPIFEKKA